MANLSRICAICGQREGKHGHDDNSCPWEEGVPYSKGSTFHLHADEIAKLSAAFLDQVAECFDNGLAIWHGTPFLDPENGQPVDAGRLLEMIRLGK